MGVVLGGLLLCVLYGAAHGAVRGALILLASAVPAAVVLAHLARRRYARALPWRFLAAGLVALTVNSSGRFVQVGLGDLPAPEGPIDTVSLLVGYVCMLIGAVLVLAPFARDDSVALVEAGVVWLASASILWVLVVHPHLERRDAPGLERLQTLVILLLVSGIAGMLLRVASANRPARPALLYLLMAVALTLIGELAGTLTLSPIDRSTPEWLGLLWILSYFAAAAASVHPSSAVLTARLASRPAHRLTVAHLVLFGLALGVNPVLAGIQQATRGGVDWILLTVSTLAIVTLVVVGIGRLVRRQAEIEAALAHLASRDELTGLVNRRTAIAHLSDVLEQVAAGDAPGATVLFLDVNGLKTVNDRHGHRAGDDVLCAIARRVERAAGPEALTARLGGDEMLVVAVGDVDQRESLTGSVLAVLDGDVDVHDGSRVPAHAALGVAWVGSGEHTDAARLIAEADRAMYADKNRPAPSTSDCAGKIGGGR